MPKKIFELKHIFGLKVKELRLNLGVTYQELSRESGLSVSYLSEIESGKKYPKGDKIALLAEALSVSYDDLVSLQVPKKLEPIVQLLESEFFREFPFEDFGLSAQKLVEIVAQDPDRINAFIQTISRIARSYELTQTRFDHAALRSYQELRNNYFEELEEVVESLHLEFMELKDVPFQPEVLSGILLELGVRVEFELLSDYSSLTDLRSLYHSKNRLLHINKGLTVGQRNFLMGREIAFQWLKMKSRPLATPPVEDMSFQTILNNYRASYFSAALIMPKKLVVEKVTEFASLEQWNEGAFLNFIDQFDATPEMVMQRLTNILPTYFGHKSLFFLRMLKEEDSYHLTKELHISTSHEPYANEQNEHYCRRWLSNRIFDCLEDRENPTEIVGQAQVSSFYGTPNTYFCWSIAFPNVSNKQESMSVTMGFLIDQELKAKLSFLNDSNLEQRTVNVTCERCPIVDCQERAAAPSVLEKRAATQKVSSDIQEILER